MAGHEHNYERFSPQAPDGRADVTYGIREFVVGTGGKSLSSAVRSPRLPNSQVFNGTTWGALVLRLEVRARGRQDLHRCWQHSVPRKARLLSTAAQRRPRAGRGEAHKFPSLIPACKESNSTTTPPWSPPTRKTLPIVLIRGFGGLGVEDEKRIAYQGFNDGTVYPQKRGENYIYEGLVLRFLKSHWHYRDATNVVGYYPSKVAIAPVLPRRLTGELRKQYEGQQTKGFFHGGQVIIDPGMALDLLEDQGNPLSSLWVFRYYDLNDRKFVAYGRALVRLINFIRTLCALKTGGERPQGQHHRPFLLAASSCGRQSSGGIGSRARLRMACSQSIPRLESRRTGRPASTRSLPWARPIGEFPFRYFRNGFPWMPATSWSTSTLRPRRSPQRSDTGSSTSDSHWSGC